LIFKCKADKEEPMIITEELDKLLDLAKEDEALKQSLLDTRNSENPLSAFCDIACSKGIQISVMDIVNQGEEFYAEIKRSTNGGGENSPDLDFQNDEYSIFMMRLGGL
jgi:hypothetical protein